MEINEAAAALDGNEYGSEGSPELFSKMKAARLVAVFGASDDLMEFRGAVDDESGAWNGGTAYFTDDGLFTASCDNDDCPHEKLARETAAKVCAKWDAGSGLSWRYETAIPHATFDIVEDGEQYCQGIVFSLDDLGTT